METFLSRYLMIISKSQKRDGVSCTLCLITFVFFHQSTFSIFPSLWLSFYFLSRTQSETGVFLELYFFIYLGYSPLYFLKQVLNLLWEEYPTASAISWILSEELSRRISAIFIRRLCVYSVMVHWYFCLNSFLSFVPLIADFFYKVFFEILVA